MERFFNIFTFSNHDNNEFISLYIFYYSEEVFILINIWMIGKKSVKRYCLKKKTFTVNEIWKILLIQITCAQKS